MCTKKPAIHAVLAQQKADTRIKVSTDFQILPALLDLPAKGISDLGQTLLSTDEVKPRNVLIGVISGNYIHLNKMSVSI